MTTMRKEKSVRFPIYRKVPNADSYVGEFTIENIKAAMKNIITATTNLNEMTLPKQLLTEYRQR